MNDLSTAKWSYVTRRVADRPGCRVARASADPRSGDLVVARVVELGAHDGLEDAHGRRVRLYQGDLVVGAYGNRYATDFYEGYVAPGRLTQLLTAGGVIGTVASSHARRQVATELEIVGALADGAGSALSVENFSMPLPAAPTVLPPTVVVVGSSMNAGKTTAAAALVRGWTKAGLAAGAGKVTGSGSGKDRWTYLDAGARSVIDFLDFGMSSTFGHPAGRLLSTMTAIRDALAADGAAVVVLEIADGLLQTETRQLLAELPGLADAVVLAVGDALGAVAGVEILREVGVPVQAISGVVTASPLAVREAEAATGIPVLSPVQLADGAAVELLAARASLRELSAQGLAP